MSKRTKIIAGNANHGSRGGNPKIQLADGGSVQAVGAFAFVAVILALAVGSAAKKGVLKHFFTDGPQNSQPAVEKQEEVVTPLVE